MNESDGGLWNALGGLAAGLSVAVAAWWKLRSERRTDAADSADHRAGLKMLETAQKERDQAEAELAAERKERLSAERALTTAVADQRDTQRNLASAIRDIAMLQRKLDRAGVPRSDWAPLMETELGTLDDDGRT